MNERTGHMNLMVRVHDIENDRVAMEMVMDWMSGDERQKAMDHVEECRRLSLAIQRHLRRHAGIDMRDWLL